MSDEFSRNLHPSPSGLNSYASEKRAAKVVVCKTSQGLELLFPRDVFEVEQRQCCKFAAIKLTSMTENVTTTAPVSLTDGAVRQLNAIFEQQNIPADHGLRIGVKGGGCAGFSYILGFDHQTENDQIFEVNGLRVFMQKAHAIYLLGMEIDWVEGLDNRGFSFNNPNAKTNCGCGCGTSFSA